MNNDTCLLASQAPTTKSNPPPLEILAIRAHTGGTCPGMKHPNSPIAFSSASPPFRTSVKPSLTFAKRRVAAMPVQRSLTSWAQHSQYATFCACASGRLTPQACDNTKRGGYVAGTVLTGLVLAHLGHPLGAMADVFSQFSLDLHDGLGQPISLCSEGDEDVDRSVSRIDMPCDIYPPFRS